jgi:hypothetical protein
MRSCVNLYFAMYYDMKGAVALASGMHISIKSVGVSLSRAYRTTLLLKTRLTLKGESRK